MKISIITLCITALFGNFICYSIADTFTSLTETDDESEVPPGVTVEERYRCTAIGLGPKATVDGSTITTHNNDCQECDIRITHVPARDWPKGSKRPIFGERVAYPRYLEKPEDNVHGPDYLYGNHDSSIYKWTPSVPLMYIDQVEHTYGYTMGAYAIQNEKQVSMGESTCGSKFYAIPTNLKGGKANFNMHALNEIALERCDTAVCAIKVMGELGEKYGFYGPGGDGAPEDAQGEAGEAIIVSDTTSTWMFHIASDDTGASAIWVAQRVPDDHITAVANFFVIGEIDIQDPNNFLASSNVFDVAIRHQLWSPTSGIPFNFKNVYGTNNAEEASLCTRRVWRVFTLAAPSLINTFSPYTDRFGSFGYGVNGDEPYPFSVKVDRPQTLKDVMTMNRDYYQGTEFDQSTGIDAGPFGDPMRYMPTPKWEDAANGVEWAAYKKGLGYQRVISLWRTAYSTVTQSRASLPNEVGGVTWLSNYAPHQSVFLPIYASVPKVPSSLNAGTQYKLDRNTNYWAHCVTANYLARWYRYTIGDIHEQQNKLEVSMFAKQPLIEKHASLLLEDVESKGEAISYLEKYQEDTAVGARDAWWEFFWAMTAKYRDMYRVPNIHYENFVYAAKYLTVPRWWLESIGWWGAPGTTAPGYTPVPIKPINVKIQSSKEEYQKAYPNGPYYPYSPPITTSTPLVAASLTTNMLTPPSFDWGSVLVTLLLGIGIGVSTTVILQKMNKKTTSYLPIH